MFRLRLHPTRSGLFFGIAVIAFWALLWLWFFGQLPQPGSGRLTRARIEVAASDPKDHRPQAKGADVPAGAF